MKFIVRLFCANCLRRISDLQFLPRSTSSCRHLCSQWFGGNMFCVHTFEYTFYRCIRLGGVKSVKSPGQRLSYYYPGTSVVQSVRIILLCTYLPACSWPKTFSNCPSDCRASTGAQLLIKFEKWAIRPINTIGTSPGNWTLAPLPLPHSTLKVLGLNRS